MSEERGPYQNVFLQECDVMNVLINEIVRSLKEIELSFKYLTPTRGSDSES